MAKFVATSGGYVAMSAVVAVDRSHSGRAILKLSDGTERVSVDYFEEFCATRLADVVPNHAEVEALVITIDDFGEPLEDGFFKAKVLRFPVIAWRVSASDVTPILPLDNEASHIRYPSGQVESLIDGSFFDSEEEAIQAARQYCIRA